MKLKLPLFILFISLFSIMKASTTVPALISSNQVWTTSGSPYLINNNVVINQGVSVDVQPGVSVISSGNFKLTVNGRFTAIGTYDSLISFRLLSIYFSDTAVDYDPLSNTGSQFKNCDFRKSYTNCLVLDRTDMKIDYCNFDSINYPINGGNSGDSVKLWVSNSTFQGSSFGYLIYGLRQHTYLSFTNCAVYNFGQIAMAEVNLIQYCYFYGQRYYPSISDYGYTKQALINCNYFKNGNYVYTPAIDLSSPNNSGRHISIQNNEFDSMTLFFQMPCTYHATDTLEINNNDFLHYTMKAVYYLNCFNTPGTFHTADFTNNYWNTTDTTKIKAAIYDHRNDAKVPYLVDYSSYQSAPVSYCWPLTPGDAPLKQNTTGIKTHQINPSHLALFPNPAGSLVNIETDMKGIVNLKLIDITGRIVMNSSIDSQKTKINLEGIKPGVYYVELSNEAGEKYQVKLIHY